MIPRLYVSDPLAVNQLIQLDVKQAHYVVNVMRRKVGDHVLLFNGSDGEWQATITETGKKLCALQLHKQTREQQSEPDIALYFAPIKFGRIDYLVEKATELGVSYIQPVMTERTNNKRLNIERLQANVVEAAEQCERLMVPEVREPIHFDAMLGAWDESRTLIVADETGAGVPLADALRGKEPASCAVLIGPEGGFDQSELAVLREKAYVLSVSLGPRVLRADTAALSALTIVQSALGDWQAGRPAFKGAIS